MTIAEARGHPGGPDGPEWARFRAPKGRSIGVELAKLGREMLVIPAQAWMALAELAGALVLTVWRRVAWPLVATAASIVRGAYRRAARHVTPARAVAVVTLAALVTLAASQWLDYRAIAHRHRRLRRGRGSGRSRAGGRSRARR